MDRVERSNPVYSIGIVQRLTGLSGRQIRYYEEQRLISPHRTKGNQRMYSPADVDLLLRIKGLLAQGYNIDGVRTLLETSPQSSEQKSQLEPIEVEPEIDHELVINRLRGNRKLTSLYPVNNREELGRILRSMPNRDS